MKFSPTIILLLFVLDIIIIFVLVVPQYNQFSQALLEFKTKKADLENFQKNLDYLQDLDRKLEENKDLLAKINAILPDSSHSNQAQLIYFIEKTAEDNGGLITDITLGLPRPYREKNQNTLAQSTLAQPKIYQRELSFNLVASYPGFIQFLSQIERSSLFIKVTQIDISKTNFENLLSFRLKGKTFLYKD